MASHPLTAGGSLSDQDAREMGAHDFGSLIPQRTGKARA